MRPTFRTVARSWKSRGCIRSVHGGLERGHVRTYATIPQKTHQRPFWTSTWALMLSAFTGAVTYAIGVADMGSMFGTRAVATTESSQKKKPVYASRQDMEKAITELQHGLGEETITTDDDELDRHGYSEWSSVNSNVRPVAVAYPKTTEEVSRIIKVCNKYRIPVTAFSGGTSLEGNFSTPHGGISIDFCHMDKVIALHADDMDVVVQPAVPWMKLNDDIKNSGLFFPVDPGPTAMFGGMVGTGGSGTNAVRYGTMRDWVINLTVVLANGDIIKTRRRSRKSAAGYNLTQLFVGSEGTLGVVTEITLKLAVIPQDTSVAVATFPTVRDAAAAAAKVMRSGVPVAAMEILDDVQMRIINSAGTSKKKWKEEPTIFFKFSGTKAGVHENIGLVKSIADAHKCHGFIFAADQAEQHELWSARKEALWSLVALKEDDGQQVLSTDVAVPLSRLPELIENTQKDLKALEVLGGNLGHIGDGNFHAGVLYQRDDPQEKEKVEKFISDMVDRALEMDGTCTGEHGIGLGKKDFLLRELGPATVGIMKQLKATLDPNWILNPGKIFDF